MNTILKIVKTSFHRAKNVKIELSLFRKYTNFKNYNAISAIFTSRALCPSLKKPVSEFNEIEQRLKSPKNRFQLSAGLNLEKLNTILSGTNYIWAAAQIL